MHKLALFFKLKGGKIRLRVTKSGLKILMILIINKEEAFKKIYKISMPNSTKQLFKIVFRVFGVGFLFIDLMMVDIILKLYLHSILHIQNVLPCHAESLNLHRSVTYCFDYNSAYPFKKTEKLSQLISCRCVWLPGPHCFSKISGDLRSSWNRDRRGKFWHE